MLDTLIVIVIVALAGIFLVRRHFARRYGREQAACGCDACPAGQDCETARQAGARACGDTPEVHRG